MRTPPKFRVIVGSALVFAASACSRCPEPKPQPVPEVPSAAPVPAVVSTPPVAPVPAAFAATSHRIIEYLLREIPVTGRYAGLHEYDGKLSNYAEAAISARISQVRSFHAELTKIDAATLNTHERIDRGILLRELEMFEFNHVDLAAHAHLPQYYQELFSVNPYLDRDYAPLEERAQKVLEHEKRALEQVPNFYKNIKSPLSKAVLETGVKIYKGFATYLKDDVKALLTGVGSPEFQRELQTVNQQLAKEAENIAEFLKKELPKGDASHVLGEARFLRLLKAQEGLDLPLAEFKRMGEADLATNKAAYLALEKFKQQRSKPKAQELLRVATQMMDESRKFILEKNLVTIPTDDRAKVKETPPFQRWNMAFLEGPGPYETRALDAFYYITLPDRSWSLKDQLSYLPTVGSLNSTTVHEVYPGHFLQGLWVRRAATEVQKLFGSYSFVEGWAHYAEQMMLEEGFGGGSVESKLGQLEDALLRNCRFVVAIGIHAEGMTLEAAEKRFQSDCFQGGSVAHEQAVRGTFDPGYFAYTLGKLQILQLREEAKRKLAGHFDLKRFHDELLSYGSPPVALLREPLLAALAKN